MVIEGTQAGSLYELGHVLLRRGDAEAAVSAFQRCQALAPLHADSAFKLGFALLETRRPVEAAEAFVACLRLAPGFGPAYVCLGDTLRRLTLLEEAQGMAEQGLRLMPAEPEASMGLANILHDRADYEGAAALYRQVLARAPSYPGARANLGNALQAMGEVTEALAMHEQAVADAPDNADFRFNRATVNLVSGNFAAAWTDYEYRWHRGQNTPRPFGPAWTGADISGRTILLHAEQGLGDTLQFVRYVPMVAERGARVILEVQPPLRRLLQTAMPWARVVAPGDDLPAFDVHCPLLSLPRAFGTTLETVPASIPYLRADPAAIAAWRQRLPADGRPLVGLVWAGSPHRDDAGAHLIDRRRSLREADLLPLLHRSDIHWISLQKDRAAPPGVIDLMPEVGDFADTAALAANLDLIIAVDTSVAHLAGAIGRPVWMLSRYDGCWRWLLGRDDTPWYPAMRLYRQTRPLDWAEVVQRVRADLAQEFPRPC